MRYVVAYDISDDLDRERTAARLLSHGVRLQRSVFEVETRQLGALLDDVGGMVNLDRDVVQAFRQCKACEDASRGIGQTGPSLQLRWWIA